MESGQSAAGTGKYTAFLFEIVEIGAIKLNEDKEMIGEFNQLIKPQLYHELNHITRKLIHLQMAQLEHGKPFPKVF